LPFFSFIYICKQLLTYMTNKKQSILDSALYLFAYKGYNGVSTNTIAKHAGVSEGLIFKHFKDKKGLLNQTLTQWKLDFNQILEDIGNIESPQIRIQRIMELPFSIPEIQFPYWQLVYALKWQNLDLMHNHATSMKIILIEALKALRYPDTNTEAELILSYFDGFISSAVLKKDSSLSKNLLKALQKKYIQ